MTITSLSLRHDIHQRSSFTLKLASSAAVTSWFNLGERTTLTVGPRATLLLTIKPESQSGFTPSRPQSSANVGGNGAAAKEL